LVSIHQYHQNKDENKSSKAFIELELFMNKVEAIATVSFNLWLHCRLLEIELIVSDLALRGKNTKKQEEKKKKIKSNKNFKSKLEKAKIMQMQSLSFLFLLTLYNNFLDI
jgi:hypothetical protein